MATLIILWSNWAPGAIWPNFLPSGNPADAFATGHFEHFGRILRPVDNLMGLQAGGRFELLGRIFCRLATLTVLWDIWPLLMQNIFGWHERCLVGVTFPYE